MAQADGAPMVVAVRDAYRSDWQRAWLQRLDRAASGRRRRRARHARRPRPGAGAGRRCARSGPGQHLAVADLLAGRSRCTTAADRCTAEAGRRRGGGRRLGAARRTRRIAAVGTGEPAGGRTRWSTSAGAWLTPGFVDLHVHGGGGASVDDGAGRPPSRARGAPGGTAPRARSSASSPLRWRRSGSLADGIADVVPSDPTVLGAHLEGPFLAASRCGAHAPGVPARARGRRRRAAGRRRPGHACGWSPSRPNCPDALAAIGSSPRRGITVAVGHTEADAERPMRRLRRGGAAAHACLQRDARPAPPRARGRSGAAIADPRWSWSWCSTGRTSTRPWRRCSSPPRPGRVALVTDAMAAAGAGRRRLPARRADVVVRDGRATLRHRRPARRLDAHPGRRPAHRRRGRGPDAGRRDHRADRGRPPGRPRDAGPARPHRARVRRGRRRARADWTVQRVWADGRPVCPTAAARPACARRSSGSSRPAAGGWRPRRRPAP